MRCIPTAFSDIWKIRWLCFVRNSRSAKLNLIITQFSTAAFIHFAFSKNGKICRKWIDSRVKLEKFNFQPANHWFFYFRSASNSPCCQLTTQRVISHNNLTNSIWTVLNVKYTSSGKSLCIKWTNYINVQVKINKTFSFVEINANLSSPRQIDCRLKKWGFLGLVLRWA